MRLAAAIILLSAICVQAQFGFMEDRIGGTNLVAHWTLNGNLADVSGYGLTATNINSVTFSNGLIAGCGVFTGTSYTGSYVDTSFVARSNNFTMSVWFRCGVQNDGTGSSIRPLLLFNPSTLPTSSSAGISIRRPSVNYGGLVFAVFNDPGTLTVTTVVTNGEWHHAAMTIGTGTVFTAYLDGVAVGIGTNGVLPADCTTSIGGHVSSVDRRFKGDIDDVRIYNRALTADEVARLYNGGKGTHQ